MLRLYSLTLLAAALWGQTIEPPDVPAALKPPTGDVVLARGLAIGAQIYTCQAGPDKKSFAWVLKAPDASLFDGYAQLMAKHFAGPTWMARDGSRVVAAKVASADAPNPKSVPWLLLKTSSTDGTGIFSHVTYVQRVNTAGGIAPPETTCGAAKQDSDVRVDYTAMYYFWGRP